MKTKQIKFSLLGMAGSVGLLLGMAAPAHAISTLKQVQVTNGSQIDLLFDTNISKSQIKTEYFNDVIQINLTDVSVYPAKISSVSGGVITKIFAYQYAPRLVRCRLSVKGKAESYKNKLQLITSGGNGKMLTVRLGGAQAVNTAETDQIKVQSARAKSVTAVAEESDGAAKDAKINDIDERALLERVLKNNPADSAQAIKPEAKAELKSEKEILLTSSSNHESAHTLAGGKPLPSPVDALEKLAFVVALFSGLAFAFKKFWKGRAETTVTSAGLMNSLGQFARQMAPKSRSKKMIEVISNHHLGPKKSIAVVRVAGRMLVLGITDEAINLITQISDETLEPSEELKEDFEQIKNTLGAGATAAGPSLFSEILQSEAQKPAMGAPKANNALARAPSSVMANFTPSAPQANPAPKAHSVKDARVLGYGSTPAITPYAGTPPKMSAQAAAGLSGVRAQIRSKLEGLKQI